MATVRITGSLTDFGLEALAGRMPRVVFRPRSAGFKGDMVLSTREVVANPASNGFFSVYLEPTSDTRPHVVFDVIVEWLDAASNSNAIDVIEGFQVPPQGGSIGDLAALDFLPTDVWVSPDPPPNPAISTWWLNTNTGDLFEWM